ncbi:MAG: aryl-sulfate sulfotransferase, partial [Bdellovibrionales bacterium]|nr:aryl-sulfate sulfotransferase [Bdellovibrionales bacterium]
MLRTLQKLFWPALVAAVLLLFVLQMVSSPKGPNQGTAIAHTDIQDENPLRAKLDDSSNRISEIEGIGDLKVYKADKAFKAFTLYPVEGTAQVLLLNMQGEPVHKWDVDADRARLLPNCNILVIHGTKWGIKKKQWRKLRNFVTEYDWNGDVAWQYEAPDVAHHDVHRLQNGNTIFLHRTVLAPFSLPQITDALRKSVPLRSDTMLEVDQNGDAIWQWHAHENLDVNSCGKRSCSKHKRKTTGERFEDWTHINTVSVLPENHWYREGHEEFKPGNIISIPRNHSRVMIIDRDTKKIVWHYDGDYKGGLGGGHEPHMIAEGLPGAGNLLIFDNGPGTHTNQSFALEINPVTKKVVWVYDAGSDFYSRA